MLINLSNHPSDNWEEDQKKAAAPYGAIYDVVFPVIDPTATSREVESLADSYAYKVAQLLSGQNEPASAVHLMGELTFCFALVARLQKAGIICIASTTRRETVVHPDGSKTSRFGFVRFREYSLLTPM